MRRWIWSIAATLTAALWNVAVAIWIAGQDFCDPSEPKTIVALVCGLASAGGLWPVVGITRRRRWPIGSSRDFARATYGIAIALVLAIAGSLLIAWSAARSATIVSCP